MFSKIPVSFPSDKGKTITIHRFPRHIADDPNYSLQEAYVLCRIWSFENSTPPLRCYLSYDQWATFLRCHRRQAIRIMNGLVEKKCLHKDSRGLETNIWRLASHLHHPSTNSDTQSPLNVTSDTQSPLLVTTCHHHSDTQSPLLVTHSHPRRSLEDHKEDHLEDQVVADAPLPTEPLSKDSLIDLDSVKEPLETLAEPETSDLTQPPQVPPPPLPKPHRFLAAELSEAHRAKLLAQIKSLAQRAGLDPEKLLNEQLAACERWSHKDNKKDKFRDCWLATLQRQWIGKKIKELAANPKKPAGPSGLTYPQVETIFRDFWNEAHGLSRLDCRFVTEKQEPFIEKTYKTFAKNENDFLEFLRKQDPHQFNKQWIQIWMQFKQIESETAK